MIALPDLADDVVRTTKAHCLEPTPVSKALLAAAIRQHNKARAAAIDLLRLPGREDEHDRALCEDAEDYVI